MNYPRLLVLSHNSFSKSNSNGRTLGSLLQGWPKDRIAQFCISSDGADFDVCENYYCVTDADVLRSTLHLKAAKRRDLKDKAKINSNDTNGKNRFKKTALKMLIRNLLWNFNIWKGKDFIEWLDTFSPDIVLLQSGESFFMHDLARKTAQRFDARLTIFNTEAPFLFKGDYFQPKPKIIERLIFPLFQRIYQNRFRIFMNQCQAAIYGNKLLERDYRNAIEKHCNSTVIYTASELDSLAKEFNINCPRFSYLGNMSFFRAKALAIVGQVLQSISKDYLLDVYGSPGNDENEKLLNTSPGLRFHGRVNYDEVKRIISNSDVIFHVEYNSEEFAESLKYGFSTKIADCIASQRIFVLFAPYEIAGSQYVKTTQAGVYCENELQLKDALIKIINDSAYRTAILSRCREIAYKNHNSLINRNKMIEALV